MDGRNTELTTQSYNIPVFLKLTGQDFPFCAKFEDKREYLQKYIQIAEIISNSLNREMLQDPICHDLSEKIETSFDHGYFHFRRNEKWMKDIWAKDLELTTNPYNVVFTLSALISNRTHDLIEVGTGKKESHDAAAALFALGVYSKMYQSAADLSKAFDIRIDPISEGDWQKIVWAAAFINANHSKPEKAPGIEMLENQNLLDPAKLLQQITETANKSGKTIYEYFPQFEMMRDYIDKISVGEIISPKFNKSELQAIKKQLVVMSGADKLDGIYPADLSATRTTLSKSKRIYWNRMDSGLSLEEEFDIRRKDGGEQESTCDLNRLIFELSRVDLFQEAPPYLWWLMHYGLKQKAVTIRDLTTSFVNGDLSAYENIYKLHEQNTIQAMLKKAGVDPTEAEIISKIKDEDYRVAGVHSAFNRFHKDPIVADQILSLVHKERDKVLSAIKLKYEMFSNMENPPSLEDKTRIIQLIDKAIRIQEEKLQKEPGSWTFELPYDGYYYMDI
jgi:hypothetical protein